MRLLVYVFQILAGVKTSAEIDCRATLGELLLDILKLQILNICLSFKSAEEEIPLLLVKALRYCHVVHHIFGHLVQISV